MFMFWEKPVRASEKEISKRFELACEKYAQLGVDPREAIKTMVTVPLSLHCWQGDDVRGFEQPNASLEGGGIQVTGSFPGRARTPEELRQDMEKALSLIPGQHRVNLHAIYGEFGGKPVDRDQIEPEHYQGWVEWAKEKRVGLDFNATCFSHPKAADGFTLSHPDAAIRDFWIEHVQRCRYISAEIGEQLKNPVIHNLWIPDGSKDLTVSRYFHRETLLKSLNEIFSTKYPDSHQKDSMESKLFGIGSEAYVVGSFEFYFGYALKNGQLLCLDLGHFHPTESIADKIPALMLYFPAVLLHISRGVRWDSDHVVLLNDDVRFLFEEIVRCRALDRVHLALDFFDASINRVGAWVIGARATLKALLFALLEPTERLIQYEREGNLFARLALLEEIKTMPFGDVWDYYCLIQNVPPHGAYIPEILQYEKEILEKRG